MGESEVNGKAPGAQGVQYLPRDWVWDAMEQRFRGKIPEAPGVRSLLTDQNILMKGRVGRRVLGLSTETTFLMGLAVRCVIKSNTVQSEAPRNLPAARAAPVPRVLTGRSRTRSEMAGQSR